MSSYVAKDKKHIWHALTQHSVFDRKDPIVAESASACTVVDVSGRRFFDGTAGLWCVNVGHGRERLARVAYEQMKKLAYFPMTQGNIPAVEFAAKLNRYLPHHPRVYYSNSGSEANETAFKIARQYWRQKQPEAFKYKFIARYRAYHGTTLATLSATGQMERKLRYEPLLEGFLHVHPPYCYRCAWGKTYPGCELDCAYEFQRVIDHQGSELIAAIIVEPIMAGGGIIVPPDEYLPAVAKICRENNILLIVDEVVNAFGRTGKWFGHQYWDVIPDIVVMAKGVASGYMPIGVTATTDEIFDAFKGDPGGLDHLRHVNTFGGHPVACAVALENINIIEEEGLCDRSREMGDYILDKLKDLQRRTPMIGDVRGRGLFIGVELVEDRDTKTPVSNNTIGTILEHAAGMGVLIGKNTNTVRNLNNILMMAPPLVISKSEADNVLAVLEESINAAS